MYAAIESTKLSLFAQVEYNLKAIVQVNIRTDFRRRQSS